MAQTNKSQGCARPGCPLRNPPPLGPVMSHRDDGVLVIACGTPDLLEREVFRNFPMCKLKNFSVP
eukprot:8381284-Alexandrium_andersonii.AAC.1